jgi:hypothetical protein
MPQEANTGALRGWLLWRFLLGRAARGAWFGPTGESAVYLS